MRIHFSSLVCVDFDLDLIPHWIGHYKVHRFDSYHVFLHSPTQKSSYLRLAITAFEAAGFTVRVVDGNRPFAVGNLRRDLLYPYSKRFPGDHFMVIADSDEFQEVANYRAMLDRAPTIRGVLVDRWDTTLHPASYPERLHDQYPMMGEVWQEVVKLHPGLPEDFHRVVKKKVCAMPCGAPGDYNGSHLLLPDLPGNDVPVPVEHYSWRDTVIDRMCGKWYFTPQSIWYVMEYFGMNPNVDAPNAFWERVVSWEAEQAQSKGWIPDSWTQEDYERAMSHPIPVTPKGMTQTPFGAVDLDFERLAIAERNKRSATETV